MKLRRYPEFVYITYSVSVVRIERRRQPTNGPRRVGKLRCAIFLASPYSRRFRLVCSSTCLSSSNDHDGKLCMTDFTRVFYSNFIAAARYGGSNPIKSVLAFSVHVCIYIYASISIHLYPSIYIYLSCILRRHRHPATTRIFTL